MRTPPLATGLALGTGLAVLVVAGGVTGRAQQPAAAAPATGPAAPSAPAPSPPAQPTFRGGVERVTVDATVVANDGTPIKNLTAADFTLNVDGKPRAIESVEFVSFDPQTPAAEASAARADAYPEVSTNTSIQGRPTRASRLVTIVIDTASFKPGEERPVVVAGTEFVRQLPRTDRVGLLGMPTGGPSVDFSLDHDRVIKALTSVSVGGSASSLGPAAFEPVVGLWEAVQIVRRDQTVYDFVFERECGFRLKTPNCPADIRRVSDRLVLETRSVNDAKIQMLRALIERLSKIEGTKIILLLSQGIAQIDMGSTDLQGIADAATRGGITVYTIQMYRPFLTADTGGGPPPDFNADRQFLAAGLENITSASGGTMLKPVGSVEAAFRQVAREISGRYVLSFNVEAEDRTGKARKIDLAVSGAQGRLLRYRRDFIWRTRAPATMTNAAPGGEVGALLGAGEEYAELPIAAATFTSPDAPPHGQRSLLWLRVGVPGEPLASAGLQFEIFDEKNVRVSTMSRTLQGTAGGGALEYTARVPLPAGRYVLRVAARDQAGRRGTLEHPFEARLASASSAPVAVGTMLLLDQRALEAGRTSVTRVLPPDAAAFHAYVELQAPAGFAWDGVQGSLEIVDPKTGGARETVAMELQETNDPSRRALGAEVPVSGWPLGTFTVRATIASGATTVAATQRDIVVQQTPPAPGPAAAPATAAAAAAGTTGTTGTVGTTGIAGTVATVGTARTTAGAGTTGPASSSGASTSGAGSAEIVDRVTAYARDFVTQASAVVAEERYVQIERPQPPLQEGRNVDSALTWRAGNDTRPRDLRDATARRQLVSDVLMIRTSGGVWTNYRDVASFNGRNVGDRSKRALELFTETGAELGAKLQKVADESSRYNLGRRLGNFNVPMLPLATLQPEHAVRCEFRAEGDETVDGVAATVVAYRERQGPAFIRNRKDEDVFISGKFWVAKNDARILRTELSLNDRLSGWASMMLVTYDRVSELGVLMPVEMWERHTPNDIRLPFYEGRATYSNFRRFQVQTSEGVAK